MLTVSLNNPNGDVLMNKGNTLVNKINKGEIFFFVGSGISYDSGMPSAGKILSETAKVFLPQDEEFKNVTEKIIFNENNYLIQPEVFYENLLYLTNSINSLCLWNSLSPTYLKNYTFPIVPNINHLFIVDYSVNNNVPIFTTNFDTLFEEASKELGYKHKVVLPYTKDEKDAIESIKNKKIKKNIVYIFKLHGTIDLIKTLHTTMTLISKVNFTVIDFLEDLCTSKHIVFVGYSGKDIDYFPEIKKRTIDLKPFWVNKFDKKDETYRNSEEIKAIRVEGMYPSEFFEKNNSNQKIKTKQVIIDPGIEEKIFTDLQKDIKNVIDWSNEDKILLLGLLCKEIGEYEIAYDMLLKLYHICFSLFSNDEKRAILLINLSKLAHENSKYESCGYFAKNALEITKKDPSLDSYSIVSLCQISESKRMLIAHDISFFYNFNYFDSFLAIMSFIKNGIIIKRKVRKIKAFSDKDILTSHTFAVHDSMEHKIRFIALLQAIVKPSIDKNITFVSSSIRKYLTKKWQKIRKECVFEGYSHGVANTFKFQTRIDRNMDALAEGEHIYDLTTAATGKGLALRNRAEDYFKKKDYERSKQFFGNFFDNGINSGNKLNAIKGLLGIAKCNKALAVNPLLEQDDLEKLKDLMRSIEGKNWQKYFIKILNEIEKSTST
ncbi:hypothetical protein D4R71_03465 [bacterium]|nr:MAG: hypothetical protein D4R71_03465 [bacterium]